MCRCYGLFLAASYRITHTYLGKNEENTNTHIRLNEFNCKGIEANQ